MEHYEKKLFSESNFANTFDVDSTVILVEDVMSVAIDDIYRRVDGILDLLLPIEGLEEINEVKQKIKELKDDLY